MKNKHILILVIFSGIFFLGLSFAAANELQKDNIEKLRWIESASPENDAKKAIERNDFRLKAVYGYSIEIPGVSPEDQAKARYFYGIDVISGTSDSLVDKEHARLNKLAIEYAEKYNHYILRYKNME